MRVAARTGDGDRRRSPDAEGLDDPGARGPRRAALAEDGGAAVPGGGPGPASRTRPPTPARSGSRPHLTSRGASTADVGPDHPRGGSDGTPPPSLGRAGPGVRGRHPGKLARSGREAAPPQAGERRAVIVARAPDGGSCPRRDECHHPDRGGPQYQRKGDGRCCLRYDRLLRGRAPVTTRSWPLRRSGRRRATNGQTSAETPFFRHTSIRSWSVKQVAPD